MAKTDDDVNVERFLPLLPALAYLEERTKSRDFAELLLRWGLANGPVPGGTEGYVLYHKHSVEVSSPDGGKPPVPGRVIVPAPPYDGARFWRSFFDNDGPAIDWGRSDATRTDPACELLDGTWQAHRIVRLRGVVVSVAGLDKVLQSRWLLPLTDALATPATSPPLAPSQAQSQAALISAPRNNDEAVPWLKRQRPQGAGETYTEYVDSLMDACQERWTRKTVLNRLGDIGRGHGRRRR